jgi:hypothetical protein
VSALKSTIRAIRLCIYLISYIPAMYWIHVCYS